MQDPLIQESFIKSSSDHKSLTEFLSLYNSFTLNSNEALFTQFKTLEQSLKNYLKKSNKTILTHKSSYGLNSHFCDQTIYLISKTGQNAGFKDLQENDKQVTEESVAVNEQVQLGRISLNTNSSFCQVFNSPIEAIFDVQDGASLTIGGFGVVGTPESLMMALHEKNLKKLNVTTCLAGTKDSALGRLLASKQVARMHISHVGSNTLVEEQFINGELEVEFTTQGTLVEKIRAASMGLHSFYSPSGAGTFVEKGSVPTKFTLGGRQIEKSTMPRSFIQDNNKKYFLEHALSSDFALIKAWKADPSGNLVFRSTARNSNPDVAGSCRVTIAEVEELVPLGTLDPDQIHVPGIFIQRLVISSQTQKYIERLSFRKDGGVHIPGLPEQVKKREKIAKRAAREIRSGMYINLGIGIPTLIPNYIDPQTKIVLHGENGVLGIGPYPEEGKHDADTVNAGRETITILPGGSVFSSTQSFGMIRGNHLDITFLGGLQVSQFGDLANWIVPNIKVKGMGGAVDLVCSTAKCIVCMEHTVFGNMKILKKCKLPLTGKMVVDKLITDLAVFEFEKDGMVLVEIAEGVSVDALKARTQAEFCVSDKLKVME